MPPTKKCARSPEVDRLSSTRQSTLVQIHEKRLVKRRWRGPKDDRLKALEKLNRSRRHEVFSYYTADRPNTTRAPQINAGVHHTAPAPVTSPLQRSPGPAVPHSPPPLPVGGDEGESEGFNDCPVSPNVPLGSGLPTVSWCRDTRAPLRQTKHLDEHTSAWNKRRNSQATQWNTVSIPRLMPTYLANRAATESGRVPPPSRPNHQCQCNTVALKVEMVTWDRKFSPHLQLFADYVLHQDPRNEYCLSASAIHLMYS